MPIYMKYEGIEGPVTGKFKGYIELESCQFGVHRSVTSPAGRGTNREQSAPSINEIVITKLQDSSSTHLFREALSGEGKKVTIVFVKSGDEAPYLSIELEKVLIANYSVSGHGGDINSRPMESLSLNFIKITYSTTPTSTPKDSKASSDRVMWDLAVSGGG